MKKLLVSASLYHGSGGAEIILRRLVKELSKEFDISVFSFEDKADFHYDDGIPHTCFKGLAHPFDISPEAVEMARLLPKFDVIFTQHYYHFCCVFASLIARRQGIPMVLKPIGIYLSGVSAYSLVYRFVVLTTGRYVLGSTSMAVPTSRFEARQLVAAGFPADRIKVIPSGVAVTEKPKPRDKVGRMVLYVGRLEKAKGIDVLLDAVETLRWPCILVGRSDGYIEKELAKHPDVDVTLMGVLPKRELSEVFEKSDVFVLPSRSELTSLVVREAQLAGVPVVATNVGGMSEIITNGVSGLLVRPSDPDALAYAINEAVLNPKLRGRLIEEGYAQAASRPIEAYLEETIGVIRGVTS